MTILTAITPERLKYPMGGRERTRLKSANAQSASAPARRRVKRKLHLDQSPSGIEKHRRGRRKILVSNAFYAGRFEVTRNRI